jgi:hypothetical protein
MRGVRRFQMDAIRLFSTFEDAYRSLNLMPEPDNYRLFEKSTGSTARVVSRHRLITHAFASFYSQRVRQGDPGQQCSTRDGDLAAGVSTNARQLRRKESVAEARVVGDGVQGIQLESFVDGAAFGAAR